MNDGIIQSRRGLAVAAYTVLVLCWVVILYVVALGDPTNTMQRAAMDWAYWLTVAILLGNGIGSIRELADAVASVLGRRP